MAFESAFWQLVANALPASGYAALMTAKGESRAPRQPVRWTLEGGDGINAVNENRLAFSTVGMDIGMIMAVGFFDAAKGGDLMVTLSLDRPRNASDLDDISFKPGDLKWSLGKTSG